MEMSDFKLRTKTSLISQSSNFAKNVSNMRNSFDLEEELPENNPNQPFRLLNRITKLEFPSFDGESSIFTSNARNLRNSFEFLKEDDKKLEIGILNGTSLSLERNKSDSLVLTEEDNHQTPIVHDLYVFSSETETSVLKFGVSDDAFPPPPSLKKEEFRSLRSKSSYVLNDSNCEEEMNCLGDEINTSSENSQPKYTIVAKENHAEEEKSKAFNVSKSKFEINMNVTLILLLDSYTGNITNQLMHKLLITGNNRMNVYPNYEFFWGAHKLFDESTEPILVLVLGPKTLSMYDSWGLKPPKPPDYAINFQLYPKSHFEMGNYANFLSHPLPPTSKFLYSGGVKQLTTILIVGQNIIRNDELMSSLNNISNKIKDVLREGENIVIVLKLYYQKFLGWMFGVLDSKVKAANDLISVHKKLTMAQTFWCNFEHPILMETSTSHGTFSNGGWLLKMSIVTISCHCPSLLLIDKLSKHHDQGIMERVTQNKDATFSTIELYWSQVKIAKFSAFDILDVL